MNEELSQAIYKANQVGGSVIIIAYGKHLKANYQVWLQDTPIAVFPPEYLLQHRPPSGPAAQVETEFVAWTSFPSTEPLDGVANSTRRVRAR